MTSTHDESGSLLDEVRHRRRELSQQRKSDQRKSDQRKSDQRKSDQRKSDQRKSGQPNQRRGHGTQTNGSTSANGAARLAPTLGRMHVQSADSPTNQTVHIGELLQFHGRRFVDEAYRKILGRPIDGAGDQYVAFLLAGGTKARILRSLLDSPEGKQRNVTILGFAKLQLFDKVMHLPVLGYPARWLWTLLTLPRVVRLANHVQQDAIQRMEAIERTHNANAEDLELSLAHATPAADDGLNQRVAAIDRRMSSLGARMEDFFEELDLGKSDLDLDRLYTDFEDRFRGSSESVADKQRQYIDVIHAAGAGTADRPIVDLGCGRGEWLGLLQDHGLVASGVDMSHTMVERCRARGIDAEVGQALQFLLGALPASFGAITGFHIIEHVPASWQIRLLELAYRALKPGGVVVFETPNPEHLPVGALRFYVDPTHVRPVPSALVDFVAEHIGYVDREIRYLWPADDHQKELHGWSEYQDYALIARRPDSESRS